MLFLVHRSADLQLWHAVQFYTVGEVVKDALKRRAGIDYQPYADKGGLYARAPGWNVYKTAIDASWQPYMQGKLGMPEAIKAMVASLPAP
jgi:hypothetical protein